MDQYLELYHAQRSAIEAHSAPRMNLLRSAAAEAYEHLGLPTRRIERYRYTDVPAAFEPNYGFAIAPQAPQTDVPQLYGTLADIRHDAITALNTMLAQETIVIHAPAHTTRQHPVRIRWKSDATAPLMQNRRLLVIAEEGASLQLLLEETATQQDFLTTIVTEVFVGPGANVEIYDVEQTNDRYRRFNNLYADVAEGARFTHALATITCGLTRNQTDVRLAGPGAECNLLGCAIADARQHVAADTLIHHIAPHCQSNELYKYVVDDEATAAFAGRILVDEKAVGTRSRESNANLVCTTTARMWTQPMLEIYADDVECSHGATVGQLNDAALFYMRQRGISEAEARTLLKQAFAAEVLAAMPLASLRERLQHLVDKRFRSCDDCQLCAK